MFDAMIPREVASQVVAWMLTYALHSTLFLGLAWLASRRLAQRLPAVEEAVWRFALVAGLLTASLQIAAGREPLSGSWSLASSAAAPEAMAPASSPAPLPHAADLRAIEVMPAIPVPRGEAPAARASLPVSLPTVLAATWLCGALLLSAVWLAGHLRLRRRLRPRPVVLEATMVTILGELRERAGLKRPVRLTCSSRLPVPIALGLSRAEICVPPRALAGLAPEQQEGMLAHELAHLVRRDPFWLAFGRLLASALFFQPLNWLAVRRLRELSELLCDEWAVGRTGRPVSLARCLAEVAGWSIHPLGSLPAPGMADRPSHLGTRIRRLLEEARSPQRRVHPAWLAAGMVILVVAVAAAAPGVHAAVAGGQAEDAAEAPALAEEPEQATEPERATEPDAVSTDEGRDSDVDVDVKLDIDAPETASEITGAIAGEVAGDITGHLTDSLAGFSEVSADIATDLSGDLIAASLAGDLSEEEMAEMEQRYEELSERVSRQVEERLDPQMKALEERLEKDLSQLQGSEEMRQLERRAQEIAERARPSDEEMAKLRAEIDKLRAAGGMSEEDKRKIREEARKMAEEHRLTDQERAEIDQIRRQAHEMAQRSLHEHRAEIDQIRQQIQEEARAMREEIRRQIENDPKIRELRERRREEREHMREDRERQRQEQRREERERTPRPPRPEHQVSFHITPEVRVRVEPAVAPTPAPRVHVTVEPAVAPVAAPAPRARPVRAPKAERTPAPEARPAVAPVAEPTPEPSTPAAAPEPPAR